jgi:non-heme chloroperoxidase
LPLIVPIADSAMLCAKLVRGATLKVYRDGSHGMCTVNKNEVNEDLLAFIKR